MSGRRSHQRFTISAATEGVLRVLRDVLLERGGEENFVAISRQAAVVGETVRMESSDVAEGAFSVRVIESRPAVSDGIIRHRLLLSPIGAPGVAASLRSEADPASPASPSLAVLTREIPVRILNCSSSGCLLECGAPIDLGTVASLRVVLQEEELVDHLQIVRCRPIEGGSSYYAGAQFLWTVPPTRQSLRVGIGRHVDQPRNVPGNGISARQ